MFGPPFSPSLARGVLQFAIRPFNSISSPRAPERVFRPPSMSATVGVGHCDPIEPLSPVGGVHGASRDIDRPAGVAFSLQISGDSVEPIEASRARNLFSHDDRGPAGTGEPKKVGPQMPWIVSTGPFAGDRERLTGARGCPKRSTPSGHVGGDFPQSGAGEEVGALESSHIAWSDILYRPPVDNPAMHFTKNRAGDGVDFVEVDTQVTSPA